MTGIFLQCRLDSKRLPRKALLPLGDKTVIEHCMAALKKVKADYHVLLTDAESFITLEQLAKKENFKIFAGSKNNVLERFVKAAEFYGVAVIVRATGDNPLVSPVMVQRAMVLQKWRDSDFAAVIDSPIGTAIQVVKTSALQIAINSNPTDYHKEHVTPYVIERPEIFKVSFRRADEKYLWQGRHVTLDTQDDYIFFKQVYSDLYNGAPIKLIDLMLWLKKSYLKVII